VLPTAVAGATVGRDADTAAVHRGRRRALTVVALVSLVVLAVLVVILVPTVGAAIGIPVAVVVGAAAGAALWWGSTPMLLRALGTGGADEDEDPRVFNLVDGLCATMGLPFPDIQLLDDASPDALALGRRPDGAVLVLTTGLLESLDPVELEGVLAHELTHVKRGDIAPATVAAAAMLPVARIMPNAGSLVHRWAGRGREFDTDRLAVTVTRYPPGLRQALATMGKAANPPSGAVQSALATRPAVRLTRWLWTVAPGGDLAGDVGELDAPAVRMAALDEW
jgi:Zn-dependent protease with chaperone function